MKIIFLDVDGVLNDQAWLRSYTTSEIDEARVERLAEIVKATDAKIVLSSSWRVLVDELDDTDMYIWDDFVNKLRKFGLEVYDRTPVIGMDRPLEIKTWLDCHDSQVDTYISLDDDFRKEDYVKHDIGDCLIKTSFYCGDQVPGGLQAEHVQKAIEILGTS